jgi:hypothetical protein
MECLKIHSLVVHTNRKVVNYSKDDPMNQSPSAPSPATACPKREALMRDSGHSFIKISTELCEVA